MFRQLRRPFVILHFSCDPTVLTVRGTSLSNLGYRVVDSHNGFETIEMSTSGKIDALVLELDRNHTDVLLIAQEIKTRSSLVSHDRGGACDPNSGRPMRTWRTHWYRRKLAPACW